MGFLTKNFKLDEFYIKFGNFCLLRNLSRHYATRITCQIFTIGDARNGNVNKRLTT